MKYIFMGVLVMISSAALSQKYILLDQHLTKPVIYTDHITTENKFNDLFPVDKKSLNLFVTALEEIAFQLKHGVHSGNAKQYKIGCLEFTGIIVPVENETRLDYVITSNCDNVKIAMHLSDAKLKNSTNAYFINTWIKYIRNTRK